jgi:hypothetical protein
MQRARTRYINTVSRLLPLLPNAVETVIAAVRGVGGQRRRQAGAAMASAAVERPCCAAAASGVGGGGPASRPLSSAKSPA